MLAQARKMQADMEKAKAELAKKEFTTDKQGVKVVMTGDKKLKSLVINPILFDPEDKDIVEGLIVLAVNELIDRVSAEEDDLNPKLPRGGF